MRTDDERPQERTGALGESDSVGVVTELKIKNLL